MVANTAHDTLWVFLLRNVPSLQEMFEICELCWYGASLDHFAGL